MVGLKVVEKRKKNILGLVELIAKKTMEQPTINKLIMKNINTLTLTTKYFPQLNEMR